MKRCERERWEQESLNLHAQKASESRGRHIPEQEDAWRTIYQRDRDRILHSKSFRRLMHKTQVFIAPEGDHYRTRLTHTLEVAQVARTMARALDLNEDLVEAIALGHDVGHTPFGHAGEDALRKYLPDFTHAAQSVRTLSLLESKGSQQGLNLSWEVLDGIRNHTGSNQAHTLEGQLIKFADRIAYINHDIDDAIRAEILTEEDLPSSCLEILGATHGERIETMIGAVIDASENQSRIQMQEPYLTEMMKLRSFLTERVYLNTFVKGENKKLGQVIEQIFNWYKKDPMRLPAQHLAIYERAEESTSLDRKICDYIAGMTDTYLIHLYEELFIPKSWQKMD